MSTRGLSTVTEEETNWRRRISLIIGGAASVIVVYAYLYQWAKGAFVGNEISLIQSTQVVIDALSQLGIDPTNRERVEELLVR